MASSHRLPSDGEGTLTRHAAVTSTRGLSSLRSDHACCWMATKVRCVFATAVDAIEDEEDEAVVSQPTSRTGVI